MIVSSRYSVAVGYIFLYINILLNSVVLLLQGGIQCRTMHSKLCLIEDTTVSKFYFVKSSRCNKDNPSLKIVSLSESGSEM